MQQVMEAPTTYEEWVESNPIRAYRKGKGWSQFQAAIDLSCSPSAIGNYELGRQTPSAAVLDRFARRSMQRRDRVAEEWQAWKDLRPMEWEA